MPRVHPHTHWIFSLPPVRVLYSTCVGEKLCGAVNVFKAAPEKQRKIGNALHTALTVPTTLSPHNRAALPCNCSRSCTASRKSIYLLSIARYIRECPQVSGWPPRGWWLSEWVGGSGWAGVDGVAGESAGSGGAHPPPYRDRW